MKFVIPALSALLLTLCCGRRAEGGAPQLLRAPYLQMALGDSMTVRWRTDRGTAARVEYRTSDGRWLATEGAVRPTNTGVMENEVVLKDLRPGARYDYRVFTDGGRMDDGPVSFVSPLSDTARQLRFFAVGDIGEPEETEGTPGWLNDALVRDTVTYQFGLLLGDIVYPDGASERYDANLFRHFRTYFPTTPTFPVLGNHDWHDPEDNYLREWRVPGNGHYYAFRSGNVRFIALDTGPNGELYDPERQVPWLRQQLDARPRGVDWTVVFLHHNGNSCTYKTDYAAVVALYPLFTASGVDLVLNGHAHTYERLRPLGRDGEAVDSAPAQDSVYRDPAGFVSITVGSGGKLRGTKGDPTPYTPDPEGCMHPGLVARAVHDWAYLGLEVDGNRLRGTAYRTRDNAVVDAFEIVKED